VQWLVEPPWDMQTRKAVCLAALPVNEVCNLAVKYLAGFNIQTVKKTNQKPHFLQNRTKVIFCEPYTPSQGKNEGIGSSG